MLQKRVLFADEPILQGTWRKNSRPSKPLRKGWLQGVRVEGSWTSSVLKELFFVCTGQPKSVKTCTHSSQAQVAGGGTPRRCVARAPIEHFWKLCARAALCVSHGTKKMCLLARTN